MATTLDSRELKFLIRQIDEYIQVTEFMVRKTAALEVVASIVGSCLARCCFEKFGGWSPALYGGALLALIFRPPGAGAKTGATFGSCNAIGAQAGRGRIITYARPDP